MKAPRIAAFALLFAASSLASAALADDSDEYRTDPKTGHSYRVRFDPGDGANLRAGMRTTYDGALSYGPTVAFDITARSLSGDDDSSTTWEVAHHGLGVVFQPQAGDAHRTLDLSLYGVLARRHTRDPAITIPTLPPTRVAFPFDLAFELELGRAALRNGAAIDGSPLPVWDITPVESKVYLDPLRSRRRGHMAALGFGPRYDVRVIDPDGDTRTVHAIAPFSDVELRLRFEDQAGLVAWEGSAEAMPMWTSEGPFALRAEAHTALQRVLLAIDDQPIVVFVSGDYAYRNDPGPTPRHEVRATLGLTLRIDP